MARLMALDVGEKTIGVAFSDESGTLATPGNTLFRREGFRRDMAALRDLASEREVARIIVGMPLMPDGTPGPQAVAVEEFIARLRGYVRIPIERCDEAFTTAEAERILDELGRPRREHKQTIDSIAACLILQDYLARRARIERG
ncbi:MAG TPA: Holliday junction resolvase RuvX [Chthonomonadaceae bacterium]|nr:Holliday junction resolvase RuvX [Chthonomonadaceae bacterium]